MYRSLLLLIILFGTICDLSAQFTQADSLRGALNPARSCYDVVFYDLHLDIDLEDRFIKGYNDIHFRVESPSEVMQIDLFDNMRIRKIELDGKKVEFSRIHNAVMVKAALSTIGDIRILRVSYEGHPITAKMAPWDGGFVWSTEDDGRHFVGVACEGIGASLWWPNKDHLSDEPDSMAMHFTVPAPYYCVSNGILTGIDTVGSGKRRFNWYVHYPINNYNVTVNIADYEHFTDHYISLDGDSLMLDYYVLRKNLKKAQTHFSQVHGVLEAFEFYFGKYPFWHDGFCLVESPYLGMEHQSAIAYGNGYKRGYLGSMIPRDMDWDYIIVHETGHEYWGNAVSVSDHGEMWIHESFTTYMEALYVEYTMSDADARRYLLFQKPFIQNQAPIIGPLDVNFDDFGSSDLYFKGSWILHTLRHTFFSDSLFFHTLRTFYEANEYGIVNTRMFIDHINNSTGKDYSPFFSQYLYRAEIPLLEYHLRDKDSKLEVVYKWEEGIAKDFTLPVRVGVPGEYQIIYPATDWKVAELKGVDPKEFVVGKEFALLKTREVYPDKK